MLQLILERGQSYEDLAAVLGVGIDEVRSRARGVLTELAGADPDAEVGLTDYLLGQADPIGRADAVRHLQNDPEAYELASGLEERLREIAPEAELPQLPKARVRRGGVRAAPPRQTTLDRLRGTLSRRQQQAIVALLAGAVLVIAGVLALAGAFGGGEEAATDSGAATTATDEGGTTASEGGDVITRVVLEPQGGEGSGEAIFGVATADQPYVDLSLDGLSAPPQDNTYVIWLLLTPEQGYPLSPLQVNEEGSFSDRFPIPAFAIPIASRARFVDISLTENRPLLKDLRRAVQQGDPILAYKGESVLRGEIPAAEEGGVVPGGGAGGGEPGGGSP